MTIYSQKGFTLVEVLVALFIISITITAVMFLLTSNNSSAIAIKNNYIASGLLQEGMEVIRNIRDSDWHANRAFGSSIPDGQYRVQWNSASLLAAGGQSPLRFDASTGLYSYDAGPDTLFQRSIDITTISVKEKKIVVTIQWRERGIDKAISAENHLFDWR